MLRLKDPDESKELRAVKAYCSASAFNEFLPNLLLCLISPLLSAEEQRCVSANNQVPVLKPIMSSSQCKRHVISNVLKSQIAAYL